MMAAITMTPSHQSDLTTYEEAHKGAAEYLQSRLNEKDERLDKSFEIPVIDLGSSFSTDLADRQVVAAQIRKACTTSGFFYITNHGVSKQSRTGILDQSKRFYDVLSLQQKEKLHIRNSNLGLGWEPSEYTSIAGDQERKEGFNFAYEEALDPTGGDGLYRNLDGTKYCGNMWPKEEDLPGFHAVIKDYYGAVSKYEDFGRRLLTVMIGSKPCTPSLSTLCALA
jgi:isopenicillin N synthase-like dioxygenase